MELWSLALHADFYHLSHQGSPMLMLLLIFSTSNNVEVNILTYICLHNGLYISIWTECFPKWKISHNHEWVSFPSFPNSITQSSVNGFWKSLPTLLICIFLMSCKLEHNLIYLLIIWICSSVNGYANLPWLVKLPFLISL